MNLLTVVNLLKGAREESDCCLRFIDRQFNRGHCRHIAVFEDFAQWVVIYMNGIFACGKSGKIAVFERYRSVCRYRVICLVNLLIAVVKCRHGIAVQFHIKAYIVTFKYCEIYGFGNRLGIGVDHHSVGIYHLNVAALIGYTYIDKRFFVRLNVKACLTVIIKRKLRPVAGNRIPVGKCRLGQEIFNLLNTASLVVCGHSDSKRLLEESAECDCIHKRIELILCNFNFRLGRRDVGNALYGNNEVFHYIVDTEGISERTGRHGGRFLAVHKHLIVLGL